MKQVEVIYFPKKCPKCGKILDLIRKMRCYWYECTEECGFYTKGGSR